MRSKHHYHAWIQIYIEEPWLTSDSLTSDRFRSEPRFNSPFNYLCMMTRYTLDSPLWVNLYQVFFSVWGRPLHSSMLSIVVQALFSIIGWTFLKVVFFCTTFKAPVDIFVWTVWSDMHGSCIDSSWKTLIGLSQENFLRDAQNDSSPALPELADAVK